jgi:hypothetical protein
MGSPDEVTKEWHTDVLPVETKRALDFLSHADWLRQSSWYLAGGTALTLHVGHRESLDLDFFTQDKNVEVSLISGHFSNDVWQTEILREGTLYGKLLGAKVSFILYPFFHSRVTPREYGAVRVLAPSDVAVMKIIAISQRGKKRDFVDLYWYALHYEPILNVVRRLSDQYPTVAHDFHHILKSMMYFEDAEIDPMPTLFFKADWKTIKAYFQTEVPKIARELLHLE